MVLDALFMAVFRWGVAGAALATAISQFVGGIIPLVYFMMPNGSKLRLGKTRMDARAVLKTCTNGSSEFMTNISMSIVNMLYNYQLMKIAGENGVAAYGVIMYVAFIFVGVFFGYAVGCAPVIGFHYGAGNTDELKGLLKKSLCIVGIAAVVLTAGAEFSADILARVFVGYEPELFALTKRAFMLYSISFLLSGFNILGSAFFTALNNGLVSALISFGRTLVFQIFSVFWLPVLLGVDGIWLAIVMAEFLALLLTTGCFLKYRGTYHYM